MKLFKKGAELRLTREDMIAWLEYALNSRLLEGGYRIINMRVHPDAKYVATLSIEPPIDRSAGEGIE